VSGGISGIVTASLLLLITGSLLIRVALRGKYLGRCRLVSYVKVHEEAPSSVHRTVTAGIGALSVLAGLAGVLFLLYLYGVKRGIFHIPD